MTFGTVNLKIHPKVHQHFFSKASLFFYTDIRTVTNINFLSYQIHIKFNLCIVGSTRRPSFIYFSKPSLLFLSDILLSLRPSCTFEFSFTVHSYPKSTHCVEDRESEFSMSASITADLPIKSSKKTLDLLHPIQISIRWDLIIKQIVIPDKIWDKFFYP